MEGLSDPDPIGKLMQELDASISPSQERMDLPHRPIELLPEVKKEPVDKNETIVATNQDVVIQTDSAATTKTLQGIINSTVVSSIALPSIEAKETPCSENVHIKSEPAVEEPIPVPLALAPTDEAVNKCTSPKSIETCNITQLQTNIVTNSILTVIKSEPVDKDVNSTELTDTPLPRLHDTNVAESTRVETQVQSSTSVTETNNHENEEPLPDNFFDDLIQDADEITSAALQARAIAPLGTETTIQQPTTYFKSEPVDSTLVTTATEPLTSEPIPDNFFDELLIDRVTERLEEAVNKDLEVKYSERLKELQQLEAIEHQSNKAHKKHKKKKKKSRKRGIEEGDADEVQNSNSHKRSRRERSPPSTATPQMPLIRVKTEFSENQSNATQHRIVSLYPHHLPESICNSSPASLETINLDIDERRSSNDALNSAKSVSKTTPEKPSRPIRVKSELSTFPASEVSTLEGDDSTDVCLPLQENELFQRVNQNRNGLIVDLTRPLGFKRIKFEKDVEESTLKKALATKALMPQAKRDLAKQRAVAAIEAFNNAQKEHGERLSSLIYTCTVRKLPASRSYLTPQAYENRSPLHKVNNVTYKFNSTATTVNLREWGLEAMPNEAAKVAKMLGYDALSLAMKLQTFKMPMKIQKFKQDLVTQNIAEPQSTFLINASSQTDEVTVLGSDSARRKNAHDVAVQAFPYRSSISTQTQGSAIAGTFAYEDLPLMQQIGSLNENQLMALSDFAELLRESASNAMDMYRLRQRMLDIYKCSQLPSALEQTVPHATTATMVPRSRPSVQQHAQDPRVRWEPVVEPAPVPLPQASVLHPAYEPQTPLRKMAIFPPHPPHVRPSPHPHPQPRLPHPQPRPPHPRPPHFQTPIVSHVTQQMSAPNLATTTSKYYGRGGLRR